GVGARRGRGRHAHERPRTRLHHRRPRAASPRRAAPELPRDHPCGLTDRPDRERTMHQDPAGVRTRVRAKAAERIPDRGRRRWARSMFYAHLWLGVLATGILLVIAITGVLLNHKRGLGLMPDVPNEAAGALAEALPLGDLAAAAEAAVPPGVAAA